MNGWVARGSLEALAPISFFFFNFVRYTILGCMHDRDGRDEMKRGSRK